MKFPAASSGFRSSLGSWARWGGVVLLLASSLEVLQAERLPLVWPSPNRAFLEGKPIEDFVQPTSSGLVTSGLYGGVRNGGYRFHEGLDLKVIERDRNSRPLDPAFAAMPGTVVYVNRKAGNSSYGNYVVLRHQADGIDFYTLYAHMDSIPSAVRAGVRVEQGANLGILGSTAGGYTIPNSRAHLHFEIGLQLDSDFAWWYNQQRYGSKNQHGPWNGINLAGWDPLEYYRLALAGEIEGPRDYLMRVPTAVRVRVPYGGVPDLVRRSPGMVQGDLGDSVAGWEVDFSEFGVPLRFRPLSRSEVGSSGDVEVVAIEADIAFPKCKDLLDKKGDGYVPGKDLRRNLELMFGR